MNVPGTLREALELFQPVIGLEVHAQLQTKSKLFSSAPVDYDPDRPNAFVSEYCFGLPGQLPVLNGPAVELAIRAGLALGCEIAPVSIFSRKHYFYPDLPKGYRISQYDQPLCLNGTLVIAAPDGTKRTINVQRIHMEEDAGKSVHTENAPYSLVDYNRAGVPLIEIVTAPDLRSAAEAVTYLRELRGILMAIEVCDGNMEEGSFRCDANVSIQRHGATEYGTRCELKNINSFKFVEQAIEYEILRHAKIVAAGGVIQQETRLFDSVKKETRSMRSKEEAHDYRYFPDPDLPPLLVSREWVDAVRSQIPELPPAKRKRYIETLGLPEEHAEIFSEDQAVAAYFDAAVRAYPEGALGIANMVKGDVLRELKLASIDLGNAKVTPEDLAELVRLKDREKISSSQQKKFFTSVWQGAKLSELVAREGSQIDDPSVLDPIIADLVAKYPKDAAKIRDGEEKMISFFMGQVMKATGGKAKPQTVRELILAAVHKIP